MTASKTTKRPGVLQIAKLAGVSIGTVDRALHNRPGVSSETRKKILRIAKELSYTPNPAARILGLGRVNVRIGVCIPTQIRAFYDQMRAGIFDEARRTTGLAVDIVYDGVNQLGDGEHERVARFLDEQVEAIIVTPGNPKIVGPLIDKAEKHSVRVICITTDAAETRRSSVVCVDPELNGRLASELMAKFVPPGAKVAAMTGMLTAEEHRLKMKGFHEGFLRDCENGEFVEVVEDHDLVTESYAKACELLDRCPDLRGIYISTANCLSVCRAIREKGLSDQVHLITTDLFPEMVPYFDSGTIQASIYQNPYLQGQTAVRLLVDHLLHGTKIVRTHYLNPGVILRANLHLFREVQQPLEPTRVPF
jgi:LacI family transcriptional regulator